MLYDFTQNLRQIFRTALVWYRKVPENDWKASLFRPRAEKRDVFISRQKRQSSVFSAGLL